MNSSPNIASRHPLKLEANRVRRSYQGGLLLETWLGCPAPQDSFRPESWIGSVVEAKNPQPLAEEGLSRCAAPGGTGHLLRDHIAADPKTLLGEGHVGRYGAHPGILVKALDSSSRLGIQVHPDRQKARMHFDSPYGKTEAWYILDTRCIDGEDPYVLLGFKPGIQRAAWEEYFREQNIDAMIDSMHRFPVQPGDVFLVEAGVPHAIGPGCFLLEIQEPVDYTLRAERSDSAGEPLPEHSIHYGIGIEAMFDCFDYTGLPLKQARSRWYVGNFGGSSSAGKTRQLIGPEQTPFFAMKETSVDTALTVDNRQFSVAIVTHGCGLLSSGSFRAEAAASDQFFVPAGAAPLVWQRRGDDMLRVVHCYAGYS